MATLWSFLLQKYHPKSSHNKAHAPCPPYSRHPGLPPVRLRPLHQPPAQAWGSRHFPDRKAEAQQPATEQPPEQQSGAEKLGWHWPPHGPRCPWGPAVRLPRNVPSHSQLSATQHQNPKSRLVAPAPQLRLAGAASLHRPHMQAREGKEATSPACHSQRPPLSQSSHFCWHSTPGASMVLGAPRQPS